MRRTIPLALTLAALLSVAARADDAPPAPAVPATAADAAAEYTALVTEFRKAQAEWATEQRRIADEEKRAAEEAKAKGEKVPQIRAMRMASPVEGLFVPRYAEFAAKHPDAPQAVDALIFVVSNGLNADDRAPAKAALTTLVERHADDARLQTTALLLDRYAPLGIDVAAVRADLVARSKSDDVRAAALYGSVYSVFSLGSKATDDDRRAARPVAERVAKDFPATRWGRFAAGALNEFDHLQVGMTAPDFEGKGPDGKVIRLSDFRGKAVLLDFWGFW